MRRKREILVGKSNGSRHSVLSDYWRDYSLLVWEASENMDCDLKLCYISTLLVCSADLDILCGRSFSHHVKFYRFMFMHRRFVPIGARGVWVCVNLSAFWRQILLLPITPRALFGHASRVRRVRSKQRTSASSSFIPHSYSF